MPHLLFEQLFAEFFVAGQKQPVLRQHNAGRAARGAQAQAAFQKNCGKIILGFGVVIFAKLAQSVPLFATSQIGYIGG